VCANNASQCASVYVTVNGSSCGYYGCGSGSNISFSKNNLSLNVGQDDSVTIFVNGYYTISSNSNFNVVSATISGSVLNIHAQNPGTTTLSICQNGNSQC